MNYLNWAALVAAFAFLGACSAPEPEVTRLAEPADYRGGIEADGHTIYLTGAISRDTIVGWVEALGDHPSTRHVVIRRSDGGSIDPAQTIGRAIRELGLTTHVSRGCYSACVDILAAGIHRTAGIGAQFGVHRPATDGIDTMSLWDQDTEYYEQMGSTAVNELAYQYGNWTMFYFGGEQAIDLGLIHEVTR